MEASLLDRLRPPMKKSNNWCCEYTRNFRLFGFAVTLALIPSTQGYSGTSESLPKCLYISSYHTGYAWSDGIEEGIKKILHDKCEIRQFDMDTKRKRTPEDIVRAVEISRNIIESWEPDVVITSDDNAAKHLIVPYYVDTGLPFVFSGINWTVEEYGFPASNVTGIVEVAPIEPMLREAIKIAKGKVGVYLGADTLTEDKNYSRVSKGAERLGSTIEKKLVKDAESWKKEFVEANETADYIVIGSNSGIEGWVDEDIGSFAVQHASVISVTNHNWMMHVSALGYTKVPQEHGNWAAKAALEILDGMAVQDIPVVTNRKWDLWINQGMVDSTGFQLSSRFTRKAKRFVTLED